MVLPWGLPGTSVGLQVPMGVSWCFHGTSELPWDFRGVSMRPPWDVGVPMGLLSFFRGTSMEFRWEFHGISVGLSVGPRNSHGISVVFAWNFHDASVGFLIPWDICGTSTVPPWDVRWTSMAVLSWMCPMGLAKKTNIYRLS